MGISPSKGLVSTRIAIISKKLAIYSKQTKRLTAPTANQPVAAEAAHTGLEAATA